jgi:hypothetical protein
MIRDGIKSKPIHAINDLSVEFDCQAAAAELSKFKTTINY